MGGVGGVEYRYPSPLLSELGIGATVCVCVHAGGWIGVMVLVLKQRGGDSFFHNHVIRTRAAEIDNVTMARCIQFKAIL